MKAKRQKVQIDQDEDSVEDGAYDGCSAHHGKEDYRIHRGPGRKQGGTGGSGDRGAIVVQEAIGEVGAKMEAVEKEKMQREQEQLIVALPWRRSRWENARRNAKNANRRTGGCLVRHFRNGKSWIT